MEEQIIRRTCKVEQGGVCDAERTEKVNGSTWEVNRPTEGWIAFV